MPSKQPSLIEAVKSELKIIRSDSKKCTYYYKKGTNILHRENGPAVMYDDGGFEWYKDGKLHREGGPAVLNSDGSEEYYENDLEIMFALKTTIINPRDPFNDWIIKAVSENGTCYYKGSNNNPIYHREDGPAIEWNNGNKFYYLNGVQYTKSKFEELTKPKKQIKQIKNKQDVVIRRWYKYEQLHKADGPAVIYSTGKTEYWLKGVKYSEEEFMKPKIKHESPKKVKNGKYEENGDTRYYKDGLLHREDGPAIEWRNESKFYYLNGLPYSEYEYNKEIKRIKSSSKIKNGKVQEEGRVSYYKNGKLHREDGPAAEWENGNKYWYYEGKPHRDDGPAVITAKIRKWYLYGKYHREDGPAVETENGMDEWYLDNIPYTEKDYNKEIERLKIKVKNDRNGKFYYKDGKFHRENAPAVIWYDGTKEYYSEGVRHRENGPAAIFPNGDTKWYKKGKLHRNDGPAYDCWWTCGDRGWYLNGILHRHDGPAIVKADGTEKWYLHGVEYNKNWESVKNPE